MLWRPIAISLEKTGWKGLEPIPNKRTFRGTKFCTFQIQRMRVISSNYYVCIIYGWFDIFGIQQILNRPYNQRDSSGWFGYHYWSQSTRLFWSKHWEEIWRYNPFETITCNQPNFLRPEIGRQKFDDKADTRIIIKVAVRALWFEGIWQIFLLLISNWKVQLLWKEYAQRHCVQ